MQEIGFDIISDLNLQPNDSFNWQNKATSLYCIVAGNVSSNLRTVIQVLLHLSTLYHGVFFVPGKLEYETAESMDTRTKELLAIGDGLDNVLVLHHNVIVVDGVGLLGSNGWGNIENTLDAKNIEMTAAKYEDFTYLLRSLGKLQKHLDVKKIVVITSAVPKEELYFGELPDNVVDQMPLYNILEDDTEKKVSHWVFGTYDKPVDLHIDNINYISNAKNQYGPYHAKRLTVSI
jgi:hypothetical protein